jgi:hypothetical protein
MSGTQIRAMSGMQGGTTSSMPNGSMSSGMQGGAMFKTKCARGEN